MGIIDLYIHKYRFTRGDAAEICPICREHFETEIHFMLHCPGLQDLRSRYIFPSLDSYTDDPIKTILSSQEKNVIRATGTYLYHTFKRRQEALQSVEHSDLLS